jgi:hypothetical protein
VRGCVFFKKTVADCKAKFVNELPSTPVAQGEEEAFSSNTTMARFYFVTSFFSPNFYLSYTHITSRGSPLLYP